MKITVYELLGMVKDGKAPKKIKYNDTEYYLYDRKSYLRTDNSRFFDSIYFKELNDEVEIMEEEKKIPEKISIKKEHYNEYIEDYCFKNIPLENLILNQNEVVIIDKINEIIDYLDYLKSKGDE